MSRGTALSDLSHTHGSSRTEDPCVPLSTPELSAVGLGSLGLYHSCGSDTKDWLLVKGVVTLEL